MKRDKLRFEQDIGLRLSLNLTTADANNEAAGWLDFGN
jgi:hypothetical protein